MSNRFLLGMSVAFGLVFVAGIAAVVGITSVNERPVIADDSTPDKSVAVASSSAAPESVNATPAPTVKIGKVMPDAVLSSDISSLAAAIKLGDRSNTISNDVWAKEVPIAQKLMGGMCDCDQRNWLRHFVQAGQQALSGSDRYADSLQVLAKLRRGNSDLSSAQPVR